MGNQATRLDLFGAPDLAVADTDSSERALSAIVQQHRNKELLRFTTVGSVDDGKSTLIGRLLHDTHQLFEDQISAVRRVANGRGDADLDYSLFTDGLRAEREQGITIDVAYRYFTTDKRKYIIADTPGHVQYTRNMATGASTASLAVVLVDVRLGILEQSRRHVYIASLLGIRRLAICVNKMDLVDFSQASFDAVSRDLSTMIKSLGFESAQFIPVSAKHGGNVVHRSDSMPWYLGPTLLEYLESVPTHDEVDRVRLRFPVQYVLRPRPDYRGYAGTLISGSVRPGDEVVVLPSLTRTHIASLETFEGQNAVVEAPRAVTLRLKDELDVSRGDMIVDPVHMPRVLRRFDAMLVWLGREPLDLGKCYLLKHTTQSVRAEVTSVAHGIDLTTLDPTPLGEVRLNDVARVHIRTRKPIFADAYRDNRATGAFILIDSVSNDTVAAGMVTFDGEAVLHPDPTSEGAHRSWVSPAERRAALRQQGTLVWIRSADTEYARELAVALERTLFDARRVAFVLEPASAGSEAEPRTAALAATSLVDAGIVAIMHGRPNSELDALFGARSSASQLIVDADSTSDAESLAASIFAQLDARGLFDAAID